MSESKSTTEAAPAASEVSSAELEKQKETTEKTPTSYPVVILAFKGTEDKLAKLWEKTFQEVPFLVVPVDDDYDTLGVLPELLVDEKVESEFLLIPANTFPAGRISPQSLATPRAYQKKDGTVNYDSFFPVHIKKDHLEKILLDEDLCCKGSEAIMKALVCENGRPELAGMSFGNVICPVTRSNPCEHLVIEALLKKIFIGCNRAGWDGIASLTDKLIADE